MTLAAPALAPACPSCGRGAATPSRAPRLFDPGPADGAARVTTPEDLAELVVPPLTGLDREHCLLVSLDTKHHVLAVTTVSIGSAAHTFMEPREVFRDALLAGAVAVAVAHNHPSGDPDPSPEDRAVTRRLARAGEVLGVALLDHLVVGRSRWRSLARTEPRLLRPGG
ncbi:MAG TPA: JAB domain-containing protein [Egibacteraceae bacterium]|nr:JAB domain-containing protein [Egibacteraceae bacterium]